VTGAPAPINYPAAVVTLTADGALSDGITCSVQTGRALAVAGLHPASALSANLW